MQLPNLYEKSIDGSFLIHLSQYVFVVSLCWHVGMSSSHGITHLKFILLELTITNEK